MGVVLFDGLMLVVVNLVGLKLIGVFMVEEVIGWLLLDVLVEF